MRSIWFLILMVLILSLLGCRVIDSEATAALQAKLDSLEVQVTSLSEENAGLLSRLNAVKEDTALAERVALLEQNNARLAECLTSQHLKYAELIKDWPLEELSQEQMLHRFVLALQKGDGITLCSLYSARFRAGANYPDIKPRTIANISIETYMDNPSQLMLQFEMLGDGLPFWEGPHAFFPRFIREDGVWKIDALPTSP